MSFLLSIFLVFFSGGDIGDIARINDLKKQAQEAYAKKEFAVAVEMYKKLVEDYQVEDERIVINLANSYYQLKDTTNASLHYHKAILSSNKSIKSQALLQLGVMSHKQQKLEEALVLFKEALKVDHENEEARYNFELVKKLLNNKKEKEQEEKKNEEEDKIQPSEFAKNLKEQADKLVSDRNYQQAYDLMLNGLKKDETVAYYKDFISRMNDIIEIER